MLPYIALLFALVFLPASVQGAVKGECSNCHTMHNSQDGAPQYAGGPQANLLGNTCIGCHSSTNSSTIKEVGGSEIPVVYNTVAPDRPLAGGNFYWVQTRGDQYGHNVITRDQTLQKGPGLGDRTGAPGCTTSCHYSLADWSFPWPNSRVTGNGCISCHTPSHHASGSTTAMADEEDGWFRFLKRNRRFSAHLSTRQEWWFFPDLKHHR